MASPNAVWGIDIGQCALKALRLQSAPDGTVEVTHFDLIEHPKILSQPDAEAEQLIQNALDKFLSRNELGKARIAVSVPGQASLARFVKLPPVEPKRIPEIVKFEAVQQIPFDIEEVEWDYQTFMSPTSPEVEVGIFAMRKELVLKHLSYLRPAGIEPDVVQLAPLALYNMMTFDGLVAKQGATILIDVGAENTDLVISDGDRIWLRSIPLGGNSFTEALVKAFKLPFSKAENLKRTAATSKYARQIFVAMRPVFSDLVSEVQRSIGFYTSLHRDAQITRVLCMGNAFRLPGLEKYLGQNLQVETVRPSAFHRLKPSPTVNAPAFVENLWSFGVAYGLGAQALGVTPISSNLLPFSIARQRHWRGERPWFAAAAAVMLVGVGLASWSTVQKKANAERQLEPPTGVKATTDRTLDQHRKILSTKKRLQDQQGQEQEEIRDFKRLIQYRPIMPQVANLLQNAIPNNWRDEAVSAVAELLGKDEKSIEFRRDVWPVVGTPQVVNTLSAKGVYLYVIETMNMELWQGRPPAATPGGAVPPPGMMPPEGMPPGGPGGGMFGDGAPPPPGPMDGARPMQAQPAPVAAPGEAKHLRVTLVGYTNTPNHATEIQARLLDQINRRFRQDQSGNWVCIDQHMENVMLVSPLAVNDVADFSVVNQRVPGCWPPMRPPAEEPRPGDVAAPQFGQPPVGAPAIEYPLISFRIVFDLRIAAPGGEIQAVQQPSRRGGRR